MRSELSVPGHCLSFFFVIIHKNDNSFLIIPTLPSTSIFAHIIVYFSSQRKEHISKIPAHGISRSVKLFLQPIKLHEINIMIRSWNYYVVKCKRMKTKQKM